MSSDASKPKNQNFRSDLKIIVIGTSGTGKTSFVNKWTKNTFSETYKATVVSEFGFKIVDIDGRLYRIQLWDLAGQDKNPSITKIFVKDAHGCIVTSDATNRSTLDETIKWKKSVDDCTHFMDNGCWPAVLVENKVDLISNDVPENEISFKEFANKNKFDGAFRSSAKEGININESMEALLRTIINRMEKYSNQGNEVFNTDRKSIVLDTQKHVEEKKKKKKDDCC